MKKRLFLSLLCGVFLFAIQANASTIIDAGNLDDGDLGISWWIGDSTVNLNADEIANQVGESFLIEIYKADLLASGDPIVSGGIETTYGPVGSDDDFSYATITFPDSSDNFDYIDYLYVKDGDRGDPAYYIFNLELFGWDGKSPIELTGFWEDATGSISHLALYGVPIPSSVLLLSTGLLGLIAMMRRRN